jgi:hypothetical protein
MMMCMRQVPAKPLQAGIDVGAGDAIVRPDRSRFWSALMVLGMSVELCGISILYITCFTLSTGKGLSRLSYSTKDAFEHHVHGAPGRARIRTGADLEVKRPGPLTASKMAATSCRLRRVFGPHGNDRYGLYLGTDRKRAQEEPWYWHCPKLST